MRIVVKKVCQLPEVREIKGTLENLKDIVGGYIECFPMFENILCVCNEDGKLIGLPVNFLYKSDVIVGDVFFCSGGEEDFESLNDKQVDLIMQLMTAIENVRQLKRQN